MGHDRRRIVGRGIVAAVAVLCFPAAAQAAQLYAAPQGTGNCSSAATACSITTAFADAHSGDELILAGNDGTYGTQAAPLTQTLAPTPASACLDVHGTAGQPQPVIYSSSSIVMDLEGNCASTVGDLDLEDEVSGSGNEGIAIMGSLDHVLVRASALSKDLDVCSVSASPSPAITAITDSACIGEGTDEHAMVLGEDGLDDAIATLRNDTIAALGSGGQGLLALDPVSDMTMTVTNTIARGALFDVGGEAGNEGDITITLDHSNYATVSGSSGITITPAGTATNQEPTPLFVDAPAGNFHEALGSPTIDAGVTSAANGTMDLGGNPRVIGASTDIGAYEAAEAPTITVSEPTGVRPSAATIVGTINPNFAAATYRVDYGLTTAYGSETTAISAGAGIVGVPVSIALTGLKSGHLYHYRLVAANAVGGAESADQVFTTAPGPGAVAVLGGRAPVKRKRAAVKLRCAADSAGCRGTLELTARIAVKVGTKTKKLTRTLARVRFSLGPGRAGKFELKLSHQALAALAGAKHKRLIARAVIVRSDGGRGTSTKLTLLG
jgi:hypothetical protein